MPGVAVAALVGVALVLAPSAARAEDIVLESYAETNRPAQAARVVPAILNELGRAGFAFGVDGVGSKYEETVSRHSRSARRPLPSDFDARVQQGYKQFVRGDFNAAIEVLTPLVDAARANPAVVANDQSIRESLRLALVSLAMSQKRSNEPVAIRAAPDTLQDLVRSYPDMPVTVDDFGPEPTAWYEEVRTAMGKDGRGTLVVKADDASAMLYLNEKFEAPRQFSKADLLPGRYRIYVRWGNQDGRVYVAQVRAGKTTKLEIEGRLDRALRTSGGWVGLSFASGAEREANEAGFAATVARQLGAKRVIVVGVAARAGKPAVVGLVVDRAGLVTTTETLPLRPEPAAGKVEAMARVLAGSQPRGPAEPPTESTIVRVDGRASVRADYGASTSALLTASGMFAIVGAGGIGAAAASESDSCNETCADTVWRNATIAVGVGVAASVVHGLIDDHNLYRAVPTLGPTNRWVLVGVSAAAVAGGGALMALDRDPVDDPKHLLLPGSALAVVGGFGLGVALSQVVHGGDESARLAIAPTISVSGDGAVMGLAGGF
jgi:hypothetical protein